MRRHAFEAYLAKVFDFPALVAQLSDRRGHPHHPCRKVFEALFLGAALHSPSLHHLERECRDGTLRRRIGPLSEDTIRYALQRLDLEALATLWGRVAKRLKRNGVLRSAQSRGLVVAAIDGIELCRSRVRCCAACLERSVPEPRIGREATEYYHRLVAVVVVSTPCPIVLGVRFQRPGEGEVTCAGALLRDLVDRLGRRFVDVLVADALYCAAPFVATVEALGLDWVVTVKDNQPELLGEVEALTRGRPTLQEVTPARQWHLWSLPEVYWARADRTVRIVRTECKTLVQRCTVPRDDRPRRAVKTAHWEHRTNVYATTLALLNIPPAFVEELGKSRWRIDTEVFQTLTTTCHLKRPSVHAHHDRALVGLTMIRMLAYLLTLVFFHRQVLSHARRHAPSYRDLAQRLALHYAVAWTDSS